MVKKYNTKIITLILVGMILINSVLVINSKQTQAEQPFFTLVAKSPWYNGNQFEHLAYFNLIARQLERIGINIDVIVQDCASFEFPEIIAIRNFDITMITTSVIFTYNLLMELYSENGSLNMFGYNTEMDWDEKLGTGKNQWYLEQMNAILPPNSNDSIQHFWEWEQYLMDELLLMQPLASKKNYCKYWDNLQGFNYTEGILQSWGKMNWDGTHLSQKNTSEIVISKSQWKELNPIFQKDKQYSSIFLTELIMDPLFRLDPNYTIKPHLAEGYTLINNTHVRINLREGIKWQSDSDGNFTDEYFDAEDVYFTLYCRKNIASSSYSKISWLKDMTIIDPYTIDLFIDADQLTIENEPCSQFLVELCKMILPEHYLNQTQNEFDAPDITHPSWASFSTNCFGTGLFELNSVNWGFETKLNINPKCWWLNSTITNDPTLDWENRFGTFSSNISQLRLLSFQHKIEAMYNFDEGLIDISPNFDLKPSNTIGCEIQEKKPTHLIFMAYNLRETRKYLGIRDPCPKDPSIAKGLAIRKAIAYAINRIEMNDVVKGGEYYIPNNPICEARKIWCNPNIIQYNHDLEKAKYYMELAGYAEPVIMGFEFADWLCLSFIVSIFILTFKRKQRMRK